MTAYRGKSMSQNLIDPDQPADSPKQRQPSPFMAAAAAAAAPDTDLQWALDYVTKAADVRSEVVGSDDGITKNLRRLETVLRRVAREAGYKLESGE